VTDDGSGVESESAVLSGGNVNNVGMYTYTVSATDTAGNTTVNAVSYRAEYAFGGFETPVTLLKPFKLGSTIPVKFNLTDGCGNLPATAVALLTLQQISDETPIGEPIVATSNVPDSGNLFRYEEGHYIYNLATGNLEQGTYLATVTFDDGATQTVTVQIKQ